MSIDRDRLLRLAEWPDRDPRLYPASTAMLLRQATGGMEVLLVRHSTSDRSFSGVWAFPGGQVESGDVGDDRDEFAVEPARRAAVREILEETSVRLAGDNLHTWSRWIPPDLAPRRFSTWFFVAMAPADSVTIDHQEIAAHDWVEPRAAIEMHQARDREVLLPTFISLLDLSGHDTVDEVLATARTRAPIEYRTKLLIVEDGAVALWKGDAGWASADPGRPGQRNRLVMSDSGWELEVDL